MKNDTLKSQQDGPLLTRHSLPKCRNLPQLTRQHTSPRRLGKADRVVKAASPLLITLLGWQT